MSAIESDLLGRRPGELGRLTWPEARARFGKDLIVLLPIGATEPHGPHLPLDVDVTIAGAHAYRTVELLAQAGIDALVLPPLSYGVTFFTEGFEGRVSLQPGTLWALLEDICSSLGEQGVRRLVFCNAHMEPSQVKVLRGVTLDRSEPDPEGVQVVFPDLTRRLNAERLGDEFRSGECHAGRYESSLVMAFDGDGVREEQRRALPELSVELVAKMQAGAKSFREVGADAAYCGDPAAASAAEGLALADELAALTVDAVRAAWPELFRAE